MKNLLFVLIANVLINTFIIGQDSGDQSKGSFNFGIKAGANLSNVYDEEGEEFEADHKLGFAGGIFLTIPINSVLGIQPEVLYSQKGFKGEGSLLGSQYSFTRTTDFIDIPLYVTLSPISSFSILVGPQFSYLLRRTDVFNSVLGTSEQIEEFENDNIRKNILAGVVGIDFNLTRLVFGIRTGWDFLTNKGDGTSQTPRYKNAWAQATIGFRFY